MMERRMAERKQFTKPLNFRAGNIEWGDVISQGHGVNISSHGLGMTSDYLLVQGMVVRISLPVEDPGITLPLFAEVTWVSRNLASYRAGLRFLR